MMRWSLSYPHVQGLGTGWYRYSRHPQGSSGWACAVGAAYAASPRRGRAGRACPSNCVESSGGLDAVGPDRSVDEQATSMSAPTLKKHRACLPRLMTRIFVFTADLSRGPVVAKTGHCVVPLRPAPGRASSMKFVLACFAPPGLSILRGHGESGLQPVLSGREDCRAPGRALDAARRSGAVGR